jgi:hypothetical protein
VKQTKFCNGHEKNGIGATFSAGEVDEKLAEF